MVIDKTTGRGCAWSIASKTITKELIADGIVGKTISPVDRLVQYIAPPIYERVPGNKDEATFDRIRITVGLPRYQFNSWEALQNEVKKYQHEIYQQVIRRVEKDRHFKRYSVPIIFLKISNVTLLRDFSLEFIFELKGRD